MAALEGVMGKALEAKEAEVKELRAQLSHCQRDLEMMRQQQGRERLVVCARVQQVLVWYVVSQHPLICVSVRRSVPTSVRKFLLVRTRRWGPVVGDVAQRFAVHRGFWQVKVWHADQTLPPLDCSVLETWVRRSTSRCSCCNHVVVYCVDACLASGNGSSAYGGIDTLRPRSITPLPASLVAVWLFQQT